MPSEADLCRDLVAPFTHGIGLDVGFGGSSLAPGAITLDLAEPYAPPLGTDRQILRGDARDLSMFCDESLDWIGQSHLLEDWSFADQVRIVTEWRRVLVPGGFLICNNPDQQRYLNHCARTGTGPNLNHVEPTFGLITFSERVLRLTAPWNYLKIVRESGPYSWVLVVQKPNVKVSDAPDSAALNRKSKL